MKYLEFKSYHGPWQQKVCYIRIRTENITILFQLFKNTDETNTQ